MQQTNATAAAPEESRTVAGNHRPDRWGQASQGEEAMLHPCNRIKGSWYLKPKNFAEKWKQCRKSIIADLSLCKDIEESTPKFSRRLLGRCGTSRWRHDLSHCPH